VSIIKLYKQNMHKHYNNLYKIVKMREAMAPIGPNEAPLVAGGRGDAVRGM
jgi:hypothetical protein